jgi:phage terminase large subunit-like protein
MQNNNYIYDYYQKISEGTIAAGDWIKLAYKMIIDGLENKEFFFDKKKADKAVFFIENFCHHSKGKLAPGLVQLELWQKAFVSCIFGIVDADGVRQFREVFCVIGRKVGKSLLASGIAEYCAYGDGEWGADIFFIAPKLDQTEIVFNDFWQSVSAEPELIALTKKRKTDIYIEQTNTQIKKIAFSARKSDGFNPHLTVCDEVAAWQGDAGIKQYEVMTSALGSRTQPLILSITTANYVNDGIFDELYARATRVLLGDSKEKRLLPMLYQIDDVEKWNDINELQKSLPNLGVSVSVDFILNEIAKAEQSIANKAEFMCKFCDIKQNSSQAWLSTQTVGKMCDTAELRLEDFRGSYCVAGIDLSQTTDLTCACVIIERNGELYVLSKFWLPSEKIDDATAREGIPYNAYIERGLLAPSGENFVDYHDCFNWLRMLVEEYEILPLMVGYDRYSAQYLVQDLKAYGFRCDDVYQGENLWGVLQEMEGTFKDGRVHIGNNDLMKMHLLNSAIKMSAERGRGRLIKINPTLHIDGVAAMSDAFCVRQKYWNELGDRLVN